MYFLCIFGCAYCACIFSIDSCLKTNFLQLKCPRGFVCFLNITSVTQKEECKAGFYCPRGSGYYIPCDAGTYRSKEQSSCQQCKSGHYCSKAGLTKPEGQCRSGYFCDRGSSSATPSSGKCKPGYQCRNGSQRDCPTGSYRYTELGSSCVRCPPGYVCETSRTKEPKKCPGGFYCQGAQRTACALGRLGIAGLGKEEQCSFCAPGRYCQNGREISECEGGNWCRGGSPSPTLSPETREHQIITCPAGFYCPQGTPIPKPCDPNTINKLTGQSSASSCQPCKAGYFCPKNAKTDSPCPPGHYCPAGKGMLECRT